MTPVVIEDRIHR